MTALKIGIAPFENIKSMMLDVASGLATPDPNRPTVWFTSLQAAADLFTEDNLHMLRIIASRRPASLSELAELTHRKRLTVTRILRKMESRGLVRLVEVEEDATTARRKALRPELLVDKIHIGISIR